MTFEGQLGKRAMQDQLCSKCLPVHACTGSVLGFVSF